MLGPAKQAKPEDQPAAAFEKTLKTRFCGHIIDMNCTFAKIYITLSRSVTSKPAMTNNVHLVEERVENLRHRGGRQQVADSLAPRHFIHGDPEFADSLLDP